MKILVVEDEQKVRDFAAEALNQAGMVVDSVGSEDEMMAAIRTFKYDVIVLDRLLGNIDSITSIPHIRRLAPQTRILVLSALAEVNERVRGLVEGADDYLGKPFHVSEFVARIRSLCRRTDGSPAGKRKTVIEYSDLHIDLETQRVVRGIRRVDLTAKEFKTLCALARNPGHILSKTMILDEVWDMNHIPGSNVVEVTIATLRAKIDRGAKPLIQSRRGVGYWLGES
ncbi:MAG: response regulator transcription factor [Pseudomonadota bacterium]